MSESTMQRDEFERRRGKLAQRAARKAEWERRAGDPSASAPSVAAAAPGAPHESRG